MHIRNENKNSSVGSKCITFSPFLISLQIISILQASALKMDNQEGILNLEEKMC